MNIETAIHRTQVYRFLTDAFLYPQENWLEDWFSLQSILANLGLETFPKPEDYPLTLSDLQVEHRRVFGLSGSLCYETEYGLPHEYRQSQELADISGFYQAFGFNVGGAVRERPDYLATELEFMFLLTLKEAWALEQGRAEWVETTRMAQRHFLEGHLGRWFPLFVASLRRLIGEEGQDQPFSPYLWLANLAATFLQAEAKHLGARVTPLPLSGVAPTPLPTEISCGDCPVNPSAL